MKEPTISSGEKFAENLHDSRPTERAMSLYNPFLAGLGPIFQPNLDGKCFSFDPTIRIDAPVIGHWGLGRGRQTPSGGGDRCRRLRRSRPLRAVFGGAPWAPQLCGVSVSVQARVGILIIFNMPLSP